MLNFYPGPSKLYPRIAEYMQQAVAAGILERNHRSEAFMNLLGETIALLKDRLEIPQNYAVFFTSSATECWEIVAQSLLGGHIQFLYNGAFGKKWFKYTVTNPLLDKRVSMPQIRGSRFDLNQTADVVDIEPKPDFVCAVQNETSNGTEIGQDTLGALPQTTLKCYDATSSMAGTHLDFEQGDVWLASVQKCFGLPSGMGIMVVSPRAIEAAERLNERNHYNSLLFMADNFVKYQTHYTPNILAVFLLHAVLMDMPPIRVIDERLTKRAEMFYRFIENETDLDLLVTNKICRSRTIMAIVGDEAKIRKVREKASENGIILGNGYGEWRDTTFRIANFPAIDNEEFEVLKQMLNRL